MNVVTLVKKYFKESFREIQKVIWPSKTETTQHTIMVVVISLAVAAFLGSLDFLFKTIIERLI